MEDAQKEAYYRERIGDFYVSMRKIGTKWVEADGSSTISTSVLGALQYIFCH